MSVHVAGNDPPAPAAFARGAGARICVGIATRGRPGVLAAVVDHLKLQTLQPAAILIACTSPDDVGGLGERHGVRILVAEPGLTRQRNAILRQLPADIDIVAFFDDDFVPHRQWLAAVADAFGADPTIACVTGHVVVDGIKGPGLPFEDARAAIDADIASQPDRVIEAYSPYGCNMAVRRSAIGSLEFDERLVLYGWLEDRDFGGGLARQGWRLVRIGAARGAHMGAKSGRVAGRRLGYSQVMNPAYLYRKGTMRLRDVADHVFRNVTANLLRSLRPEPFIDRRGRLYGNMLAAVDLLRGRLTPERAERV